MTRRDRSRSTRARRERDRRVLAVALFALAGFIPVFALLTNPAAFSPTFLSFSVAALTIAGALINGSGKGTEDDPTRAARRKISQVLKSAQTVLDDPDTPVDSPDDGPRVRRRLVRVVAFGGRGRPATA